MADDRVYTDVKWERWNMEEEWLNGMGKEDRIEDGICGHISNSKGHLSKLAEVS